jgi:hypothetical protein
VAHKPPSRSYAERLRAHRQAFMLATALGCSLAQAERHWASIAAWNRWKLARDRLAARRAGTSPQPEKTETTAPWWIEL